MSDLSEDEKQSRLKSIILDLHKGAKVGEVKERFKDLLSQVDASEIAELEQALINEGLPEEEVTRLCDVHVEVFRESLDEQEEPEHTPGHPLHTFKLENDAIDTLINRDLKPLLEKIKQEQDPGDRNELITIWQEKNLAIQEIEKHYSREENLLFPYLEKAGLSGPPSVMWSIHDQIRDQLKKIGGFLEGAYNASQSEIQGFIDETVLPTLDEITDLIYREHKVLYKFSVENLKETDWQAIKDESGEIGYTLIEPGQGWQANTSPDSESPAGIEDSPEGTLNFETGALSFKEISAILNHLPVDLTYVDKSGAVRYFSRPKDRIFTRTKTVIGRKVQLCHPPESIHVVNKIIEEFKAGGRDTADFWITLNDRFVYIRYFAIRENDEFMGVLEVTQDATEIRNLEGQKRILDWE